MPDVISIKNGTRQGSCASLAFWNVYLNPLVEELRTKGIGCHIAGKFLGIVLYADDIILLAPNRTAAQTMLKICEDFAHRNNITFSTSDDIKSSKCKSIYVHGNRVKCDPPAPLVLCGKNLPWVDKSEHLGHLLSYSANMDNDIHRARASFIDSAINTREIFNFAHPVEVIEATEKYSSNFYGSNLWDLRSKEAEMLSASWRTSVKMAWGLPGETKTMFIDFLSPNTVSPSI